MSTSGPAVSSINASSSMEIDDVSGSSLIGGIDQEASFEVALQQLRQDVISLGVRIATAGNKSRKEVDPLLLSLKQKKLDLQALEEAVSLISNSSSGLSNENKNLSASGSVVPSGLPLFQWIGAVPDDKKEVFADIEECLRRFEDVLSSHTLNFDKHWYRLLPRCLSNDLRDWLNEYVLASGSKVSWIKLKAAITGRYGVPKEQLRFERIREFLGCAKLSISSPLQSFLKTSPRH